MHELDNAKTISLVTFKRDGSPKATPIWLTGSGGTYTCITDKTSWKAKRLRNNPAVEVQVCGMSGKVKDGTTKYTGTGEVLEDAASLSAIEKAVADKYKFQYKMITFMEGLVAKVKRKPVEQGCAIRLTLDA